MAYWTKITTSLHFILYETKWVNTKKFDFSAFSLIVFGSLKITPKVLKTLPFLKLSFLIMLKGSDACTKNKGIQCMHKKQSNFVHAQKTKELCAHTRNKGLGKATSYVY